MGLSELMRMIIIFVTFCLNKKTKTKMKTKTKTKMKTKTKKTQINRKEQSLEIDQSIYML